MSPAPFGGEPFDARKFNNIAPKFILYISPTCLVYIIRRRHDPRIKHGLEVRGSMKYSRSQFGLRLGHLSTTNISVMKLQDESPNVVVHRTYISSQRQQLPQIIELKCPHEGGQIAESSSCVTMWVFPQCNQVVDYIMCIFVLIRYSMVTRFLAISNVHAYVHWHHFSSFTRGTLFHVNK